MIISEEYDHPTTSLLYLINDNYESDVEDNLVDVNGEEIKKKEAVAKEYKDAMIIRGLLGKL